MSRRLVALLAWALWALSLFGLAVIWWLDHLLRQVGRPDSARPLHSPEGANTAVTPE